MAGSSDTSVFDITVSIHNSPAGDNDAEVDDGANDDEQNAYEAIFRFMADAVCEQTNGVHRLGEVRIFKDFKRSGSVDIKWGDTGRPHANPTGIDKAGWQIFLYDNFGSIKVSDGGDDLERLGYIAAHEWGHYALGVYDEYREVGKDPAGAKPYQPVDTDVAVNESIMHKGRNAVGGNFKWLNHSTQNNIGDVSKTAQGRVYGKSGWDTLIQTTNNDPTTVNAWNLPKRTHYTNLPGHQPTAADNWFKIELPGDRATCREKLKILWIEDLEMDIVLDRSGSMGGTPIANAKAAATTLVDVVDAGSTSVGVTSFNSSVSSDAAITPIPVPGTTEKTALKNAIAGITASGSTALFDAAVFSLNKLGTFATTNSTSASQIVFLLSDGQDNASSETLATTVAKFKAAKVPLFTFGYGTSFDPDMVALANQTGGTFTQSPTTLPEIQAAFQGVFAAVSGSASLSASSPTVGASATETTSFVVDPTIQSVTVSAAYTGSVGDFTFRLTKGGTDTGKVFDCNASGGAVTCAATLSDSDIAAQGTGDYAVAVTNTTGADMEISLNIVASPKAGGTYTVQVASINGSTITYPEPIVLSVVISRELPITGATVSATVTAPDGTQSAIDLNDEGVGADRYAGDGLYSAWMAYTTDGNYNVDVNASNPAGSASYTTEALSPTHDWGAITEPGETIPEPTLPADNFTRVASTQLAVTGVVADDHADDPTGGACTPIQADNAAVDAKTDVAGDVDCFAIVPAPGQAQLDVTDPIIVRVFNEALGADPQFTVFDAAGTNEIAKADPADLPPSDGALFVEIAANDIDPNGMVVAVSDTDPTAVGGQFSISAGDPIVSDVAAAVPPGPGGGSGGGALGPWGLLLLSGLAGLGVLARRRYAA